MHNKDCVNRTFSRSFCRSFSLRSSCRETNETLNGRCSGWRLSRWARRYCPFKNVFPQCMHCRNQLATKMRNACTTNESIWLVSRRCWKCSTMRRRLAFSRVSWSHCVRSSWFSWTCVTLRNHKKGYRCKLLDSLVHGLAVWWQMLLWMKDVLEHQLGQAEELDKVGISAWQILWFDVAECNVGEVSLKWVHI